MKTAHKLKNFKRLKQVTNTLLKAELGYFISKLELKSYLSLKKKIHTKELHKPIESLPSRLRNAFEILGGSFVKLGQLLSLRYDLLPKEYCDEFSKLQDSVKPVAFSSIKKVIEEELNAPLDSIFKSFDKTPIAAASVGQVHKAVLKNGKIVAVKIQRPNIEKTFKDDIELFYYLAKKMMKHFPETKFYRPLEIIEEFEKYTIKELDYLLEAKNIEVFHKNFEKSEVVTIPYVDWKYTTKRLLLMEFIKGTKINEVKHFKNLRSTRKQVVANVLDAVTTQILEHKFFHADPHPGNIFLMKDNKIAFLDFGIVGRITEDMEKEIEDFIIALITKDIDLLVRSLMESGSIEGEIDVREFKNELSDSLSDYYNVSLNQINMTGMFLTTFKIARKYNIKVPMNYTMLGKSIITLEGFSSKYYPEFNFIEFVKPKVEVLMKKRYGPKFIFNSVKDTALDFKDIIKNLPSDVSALVRAIKYGAKINIEVDHKELKNFTLELDRSSNRLTLGIILAGLIISAAFLSSIKLPPMIGEVPLVVYILIVIITIISIVLLVSIFKEGKGGEE